MNVMGSIVVELVPLLVVNIGAEPLICIGNLHKCVTQYLPKQKILLSWSENQATGKMSHGLVTLK